MYPRPLSRRHVINAIGWFSSPWWSIKPPLDELLAQGQSASNSELPTTYWFGSARRIRVGARDNWPPSEHRVSTASGETQGYGSTVDHLLTALQDSGLLHSPICRIVGHTVEHAPNQGNDNEGHATRIP